jgi:hypothetical protein
MPLASISVTQLTSAPLAIATGGSTITGSGVDFVLEQEKFKQDINSKHEHSAFFIWNNL